MIVVDGDAVDLLQESVVRFLEIADGQRPRLRLRRCCAGESEEQGRAKVK
jgi:hypothetical protein